MTQKPAKKSANLAKKRRSKNTSWKKAASIKRQKNKRKKIVLKYVGMFLLFSSSLMFLFFIASYRRLTLPFAAASSDSSFDIRNEEVYSLLLVSLDDYEKDFVNVKEVHFLLFDAKNKKIVSYQMSGDLPVDVAGRYDEEPLEKVFGMGMLLNDRSFDSGITTTVKTIENFFSYPVDKYIVMNDEISGELVPFLTTGDDQLKVNFEFAGLLEKNMLTDINLQEAYYIYDYVKSLPSERVISKKITDSYIADSSLVDAEIRDVTYDSNVALQNVTVAVLNGTSRSGMANYGSRLVGNLGGRVIAVGNASEQYDESYLIINEEALELVPEIKDFFGVKNVLTKGEASHINQSEITRADVTLILGVDSIESL